MYIIGVDFYDYDEDSTNVTNKAGDLFFKHNGIILAKFACERDCAKQYALDFIAKFKTLDLEYVKRAFPKFYHIMATKQFWFHVFEDNYLNKNQVTDREDVIFSEPTLESCIDTSLNSGGDTIELFSFFLTFDGKELYGPPERINYWDTIFTDDEKDSLNVA